MLPNGTVRAGHIWKRFRSDRRRSLLRDELTRLRAQFRGHSAGWNWALRDVDFSVEPGESIGLIGVNGSGKSTLLKILTRVMYPYAGRIDVVGRVGALIEVASGIHPDLTGHENIYLYGSLLGLKRTEVAARFDQIVEFAELEKAIHRQVKFYSSGMKMRLGFAVAAFLEPDVLLVDEVLAVGDTTFQQRCLDRMRTVLNQGTTLIFVSHDLAAVNATCARGIWLHQGAVRADGPIGEVLAGYRAAIEEKAEISVSERGEVDIVKLELSGPGASSPSSGERLDLHLVLGSERSLSGELHLGVSEGPAAPIFSLKREIDIDAGQQEIHCAIDSLPLPRGRFYLWLGIFSTVRGGKDVLAWQPVTRFDVVGPELDAPPRAVVRLAPVYVQAKWQLGG